MTQADKKPQEPADKTVQQAVPEADSPDTPAPEHELDEMTTLHERTIAALSYVSFFAIIPFYLKKDSKFCRFHGKQGMVIALIFFFAQLLLVLDFFDDLAKIVQFFVFIYGGLGALSGRWKKMPWIYERACQLEEQLSLKSKEQLTDEPQYRPDEVQSAEDVKKPARPKK